MSRQLNTTLATTMAAPAIIPAIFVKLVLASGTSYVWSGVGDILMGGNTYTGVGALGNVSGISEGSDVKADGMTLTLTDIPLTVVEDDIPSGGTVATVTATVPGTAPPWLVTGTINTAFAANGQSGATTPPTYVPVVAGNKIQVAYQSGLASVSSPIGTLMGAGGPYNGNEWGSWDCDGSPGTDGNGTGQAGQFVAASCNSDCLLGAFCDSTGQIVGAPFLIGNNSGVLTVPTGATQLSMGINDGNDWNDNSGSWIVSVALDVVFSTTNMLSEVLTDIQLGAPAEVWFGLLNNNGTIIGDPYLAFAGQVDQPNIKIGAEKMSITLALENRLSNLQRPTMRRYTAADQQLYYSNDIAFNWVEQLNDEAWVWG